MGALLIDGGLERPSVHPAPWGPYVDRRARRPSIPSPRFRSWPQRATGPRRNMRFARKSGAHHAPRFTVQVAIRNVGEATAEGSSKQEAETAAATALLEQLQ